MHLLSFRRLLHILRSPAGSRAFEYYTEPHPGPDHYEVPADEQVTRPSLQALEAERAGFPSAQQSTAPVAGAPAPREYPAPTFVPDAPAVPEAQQVHPHEDPENAPTWDSSARLNPNYTFDTFVIGQSNRFAHASAFAVAEQPGIVYTRCSSTAVRVWVRPTCCTRSATTPSICTRICGCAT